MKLFALLTRAAAMSTLAPPRSRQQLFDAVKELPAGAALASEFALRADGKGSPHRAALTRRFDDAKPTRVVFYRDSAAWCPYCQKLWMMLEEKDINYDVQLVNMRSYGEKPASFTNKVRGGFLPALELDGQMYTESLDIMAMLDDVFSEEEGHRPLLPPRDSAEFGRARELLGLERKLFRAWCDYVFRGGWGSQRGFDGVMNEVDRALGETSGPWFSDFSDGPGLVDLQYVSHVERMAASVAYWKGEALRGGGRWPNVDAWFEAFEARPSYAASRSDWYTHANDIPPQYGDGVDAGTPEQKNVRAGLDGGDAAWRLPLPPLSTSDAPSDVFQPGWLDKEAGAAAEAAYHLLDNFDDVVKFAARGAGQAGGWSFMRPDRARLADPYAKPATGETLTHVDAALRVVAELLLADCATDASCDLGSLDESARADVRESLAYLRDRVGVPRDMSYPAARCLRATLNHVSARLE
mmetsp:Transcript_22562/g.69702  ORF Transcript_22562/g.69702 Transcript_22562/m.69702 type:complete len:468 (-) Transcript_22562:25-1428(-)